jgi:hypothetical protein
MRRIVLMVATAAMLVMMSVAPAVAFESEFKEEEKCQEAADELLEAFAAFEAGTGEFKELIKALEKLEEGDCPLPPPFTV